MALHPLTVSTAACLHFDLSTPLFAVQELTWRPVVLGDVVRNDMRLEGWTCFREAPGTGGRDRRRGRQGAPVQAPGATHPAPPGRLGPRLVSALLPSSARPNRGLEAYSALPYLNTPSSMRQPPYEHPHRSLALCGPL